MKRLIILTTILSVILLPSLALQTIRGRIVDGSSQKPLDFVNVVLIKDTDVVPAAGVVSDEKGRFELPRIPNGNYLLRISFVGYNTIEIPLKVGDKALDMGLIKLMEDSKSLSEIEVVGQGTQMRLRLTKSFFRRSKHSLPEARQQKFYKIYLQWMWITKVIFSLRNSSNVEVWINGKPSGLTEENRAQTTANACRKPLNLLRL